MIDITKPLELSDGTRVPLGFENRHWICVMGSFGEYDHCYFMPDGTAHPAWTPEARGRTLRNVRQTATGVEMVGRMEALLRRMASACEPGYTGKYAAAHNAYQEAREIVALLPPKSDEDWARKIWLDSGGQGDVPKILYEGIAKGRALALAGRGE